MENVKQQSSPPSREITTDDKTLKVYHGYGYHNLDGDVIYNVSLPPEAEGQIKIQKIIELSNNVLFIWVHGDNKRYANPTNNIVTLPFNLHTYMDGTPEIKKFYLIHLFHENTMSQQEIESRTQDIIDTKCTLRDKDGFIPEGCGNGVLTLQ